MSHYPSDAYRLGAANRDSEEEALAWVVRLNSGDVTSADRDEFDLWHLNAENARAYLHARRLWEGIGPIVAEQEAACWPDSPPEPAPAPRRAVGNISRFAKLSTLAASLVLASWGSLQYARVWQYDHVSQDRTVGSIALQDGSTAALAPDTALNSDFRNGARHISLARGEAYFDVLHDPAHPFVVSAGSGVVRVLGTAFSVRRNDDGSAVVTVTRGRVQVISGADSAFLTPDRQISFGPAGLGRMRAVDASLAVAWTHGRLIMENQPLGEVLAELDRFRGGRIVLLNSEASQRRINAVIDLERTDNWLTALASSQGLTLSSLGPLTVLR